MAAKQPRGAGASSARGINTERRQPGEAKKKRSVELGDIAEYQPSANDDPITVQAFECGDESPKAGGVVLKTGVVYASKDKGEAHNTHFSFDLK